MKTKRMFKPVRAAMTAAVALAMASPLYAAPDYPNADVPNPGFHKLDTDRDGYISREETARMRSFDKAFNEADANRDGRLDADEFAKAQALHQGMQAKAVVSDSVITAKVKTALLKAREVPGLKVNVKTNKGVVLLSGFVKDEREARRAEEIASEVKGVKNVKSNLVVKS